MPPPRDPLAIDERDEQRMRNRFSLDSNNRRFGSNEPRVIATPISRPRPVPTPISRPRPVPTPISRPRPIPAPIPKQSKPVKRAPTYVINDNTSAILDATMNRMRSSSPYLNKNSKDSDQEISEDEKKDVFEFDESEKPEFSEKVLSWFPQSSLLAASDSSADEGKERIKLTSFLDECKDLASECEALFGSPIKSKSLVSSKLTTEPKKERAVSISSNISSDYRKNISISRNITPDPKKNMVSTSPMPNKSGIQVNKLSMVRPATVIEVSDSSSENTTPRGKTSTPQSNQSSRRVIIPLRVNKHAEPDQETKRSTNDVCVIEEKPASGQAVLKDLIKNFGSGKPPIKSATVIKETKSFPKPTERINNTEKSYPKPSTTRNETAKHILEKKSSKVDTKEIIKVHKELKDLKGKVSDKKSESDTSAQEKDSDDTPKRSSRRAAAKSVSYIEKEEDDIYLKKPNPKNRGPEEKSVSTPSSVKKEDTSASASKMEKVKTETSSSGKRDENKTSSNKVDKIVKSELIKDSPPTTQASKDNAVNEQSLDSKPTSRNLGLRNIRRPNAKPDNEKNPPLVKLENKCKTTTSDSPKIVEKSELKEESNKTVPRTQIEEQDIDHLPKRTSRTSERKSNRIASNTDIIKPVENKDKEAKTNILERNNITKTVLLKLKRVDKSDKWVDKFDSPSMIWINEDGQHISWNILGPERDFKGFSDEDTGTTNEMSKLPMDNSNSCDEKAFESVPLPLEQDSEPADVDKDNKKVVVQSQDGNKPKMDSNAVSIMDTHSSKESECSPEKKMDMEESAIRLPLTSDVELDQSKQKSHNTSDEMSETDNNTTNKGLSDTSSFSESDLAHSKDTKELPLETDTSSFSEADKEAFQGKKERSCDGNKNEMPLSIMDKTSDEDSSSDSMESQGEKPALKRSTKRLAKQDASPSPMKMYKHKDRKRPREEPVDSESKFSIFQTPDAKSMKLMKADDAGLDIQLPEKVKDSDIINGGKSDQLQSKNSDDSGIDLTADKSKIEEDQVCEDNQGNNAEDGESCSVCHQEGDLLYGCDRCPKIYHPNCYMPPLTVEPADDWKCIMCLTKEDMEKLSNEPITRDDDAITEREIQICRRLILELYKYWPESDTFSFVADLNFDTYKKVIKDAIALDVIRKRLYMLEGKKPYVTSAQFFVDVRRMFNNCKTFWKGSQDGVNYLKHCDTLETSFLTHTKKWLPLLNIRHKNFDEKSNETFKWSYLLIDHDPMKAAMKKMKQITFEIVKSRPNEALKKYREMELTRDEYRANPLLPVVHQKILARLAKPIHKRDGYCTIDAPVPTIKSNQVLTIPPFCFAVKEFKAEGAYGRVYRAHKTAADGENDYDTDFIDTDTVLKIQKPKREWEFYIVSELQDRLESKYDQSWFMTIPRCYIFQDGSIFASKYFSYTLLDICNKASLLVSQTSRELLATYFVVEMLHVAEKLKAAKIVHADIKAENFMIQALPKLNVSGRSPEDMFYEFSPSLILIDFGISIDLKQFPEGTNFKFKFEKLENLTPEMLEGKPWTYQVDYYGIANIAHSLLYGSYMNMKKSGGKYRPEGTPKRWMNTDLWNEFFLTFLNIESCDKLPDLVATRRRFEKYLFSNYKTKFSLIISELNNKLNGKG